MPMLAPLLAPKFPHVLDFCRVLVDFILIAQYRSHDNTTLSYLDQALMRINVYKESLRDIRRTDGNVKGRFDFPKFHVMLHYSDHVRKFGTTDGYDTAHFEANHKFMLKAFYEKTNKRETFQEQLLWHNKQRIKVLAMKDILMASLHTEQRKDLTDLLNEDSIQATNTQPTWDPLELSLYGTIEQTDKRQGEARQWCKARDLAKLIDLPEFIPALAVFIKQQYRAAGNKSPTSRDKYLCEQDPSWVEGWDVSTHGSLTCWVRDGHNPSNMDRLVKEIVRCKPNWQNIPGHWRRDYVWVQEHENETDEYSASSIKGKQIGQLQVIVTV
ncbi:hypothetical protein MMC07_009034 [Pseudocyphellaria aurata]|nr:hypothetical protein [Pseudocyphellaria aurata]